jgi:hypothetical protein
VEQLTQERGMMLHHTAGVAHRTQEIGKHDRQTVAELQKQVGAAPRRVFLASQRG